MRFSYIISLSLAIYSREVGAQSPVDAAAAREQITHAYADWSKARTSFDRASIERMLAPEFYVVVPGQRIERKDFVDQVSVANPTVRFARYDPTILTVERKNDLWVAVITEKLEYERNGADGKPQRAFMLWITRDGWRKERDRWLATFSETLSNETWGWGKTPPFTDWAK